MNTINTLNIGRSLSKYGELIGGSVCKAPDFKEPTDPDHHTFHRIWVDELEVNLEGYQFTVKDATIMVKGDNITASGDKLTQAQRDRIDSFGKKQDSFGKKD